MTAAAATNRVLTLPSDQDASGRTFGEEELELLRQALASGALTSTKGTLVKRLERDFAARLGVAHAFACASGTAAVHAAIAAVDPEPGDEIVTSPITDMGAIAPILYQTAVPVFADVDPVTLNLTADTIAPCLSSRTRAIVVTHLFGNPCGMDDILALAASHGVPVIEDSAQAFLATCGGRQVGTLGKIGCFSLQQGKHATCGEGGLVVTDDPELARRMYLFINKAWGYGDAKPDHYFLALNYRLSELQGAVAIAQMERLEASVLHRRALAARLDSALAGLPGVATPQVAPGHEHSYWRYAIRVSDEVPGGGGALAKALTARGVFAAHRYIQKPAFQCEVFAKQRTFGQSAFPFTLARPEALDYAVEKFPGVFDGLRQVVVLPFNERFTEAHVDAIAEAIREAAAGEAGR